MGCTVEVADTGTAAAEVSDSWVTTNAVDPRAAAPTTVESRIDRLIEQNTQAVAGDAKSKNSGENASKGPGTYPENSRSVNAELLLRVDLNRIPDHTTGTPR